MPGRPQAEKPNNSQMNQPSQNGTSKQESQAGKTEKNESAEAGAGETRQCIICGKDTENRRPDADRLLAGAAIISIISHDSNLVRKSRKK